MQLALLVSRLLGDGLRHPGHGKGSSIPNATSAEGRHQPLLLAVALLGGLSGERVLGLELGQRLFEIVIPVLVIVLQV